MRSSEGQVGTRRTALAAIGSTLAALWAGRAAAGSDEGRTADSPRDAAPQDFTEHQRLVALEAIRTLRARRDYALDTADWPTYESLHAPDHISVSVTAEPIVGGAALVDTVSKKLAGSTVVHHTYSPIIEFDGPNLARGIWAMNFSTFWKQDGREHFTKALGFYHERYARREEKWLFIYRRVEVLHKETCCREIDGHKN